MKNKYIFLIFLVSYSLLAHGAHVVDMIDEVGSVAFDMPPLKMSASPKREEGVKAPGNKYTPDLFLELKNDLKLLMENPATINDLNEYGCALLHRVIRNKNFTEDEAALIVTELANYRDVDLNIYSGYQGQTPLCMAAFYGLFKVVVALIEAGADVNAQNICIKDKIPDADMEYVAPIVSANRVYEKRIKMSNLKDHYPKGVMFDGKTPLHYAYANQDRRIIQYLTDHGARADIADRYGFMVRESALFGSFECHEPIAHRVSFSAHTPPENEDTASCVCWRMCKKRSEKITS